MIISNCQVDVDSSSGASDFKEYAGHSNRQPCDALLTVLHYACIYAVRQRHLVPTLLSSTELKNKKEKKEKKDDSVQVVREVVAKKPF
jgi:hypothetical protein